MQKHLFNKYDIGGAIGTEFDINHVENLTHAIISFYEQQQSGLQRIAVAMDGRTHSYEIYQKVSQAIVDRGYQVYFLGICPTPVFVFGLHHLPVQAGIMITGSHHAKDYHGLKVYLDKKLIWGKQLEQIHDLIQEFPQIAQVGQGKIVPSPIIDQYVERIWQEFSHLSQYDFSIIIDCAHGTVGPVMQKLIAKMGWSRVTTIFDTVDGNFPAHEPNPALFSNEQELYEILAKTNKSFGIAFDGDGSRMVGMEDNGTLILGDRLLAIFAQDVLQKHKNASVVYDIKSSMVVEEVVQQHNGKSVVAPVGSPLVADKMHEVGALLGGELHGHYFFKDRHAGYDDGMYAMCRLLDILVKERKTIYDLLQQLPEQYSSYEIQIPCLEEEKHLIVKSITDEVALQKKWKVFEVDGVRVQTDKGWGLFRASRTKPSVSFRCEAKNKAELQIVKQEFKTLLQNHIKADVLKEYF